MRNTKSTVLYQWFNEVWNNDNENAIDQLMMPDTIAHGISAEEQIKGAEGFKAFFRGFRNQFHQVKINVEDVVAQDDMEAARTVVNAIHTATGKKVTFSGICMARIKNGKIIEAWNNYDFLQMHLQTGQRLVPVEASIH
jgi:predicted ester cyclase